MHTTAAATAKHTRTGHCLFHPNRGETNPQQNLSEPERDSDFQRPTAPHGLEPWGCSCNRGQISPHCPRVWVTAGPSPPARPQLGLAEPAWITVQRETGRKHSAALLGSSGLFSLMQLLLVLTQSPVGHDQSPPCCPAPAQPAQPTRARGALQPRPVSALPGLPAASHGWDSLGGQLGARGGSVLLRQQLQIPQGLHNFPTRAFSPQELHTSAQLQARLLPEHCEGSPAQGALLGSFPKPGVC